MRRGRPHETGAPHPLLFPVSANRNAASLRSNIVGNHHAQDFPHKARACGESQAERPPQQARRRLSRLPHLAARACCDHPQSQSVPTRSTHEPPITLIRDAPAPKPSSNARKGTGENPFPFQNHRLPDDRQGSADDALGDRRGALEVAEDGVDLDGGRPWAGSQRRPRDERGFASGKNWAYTSLTAARSVMSRHDRRSP